MLKVLIVSPNQEHLPDPVAPIGAAYVAAAARQAGHDVRMHDACFVGDDYASELGAALESFGPDVVGLSMRNIDNTVFPRALSYLPVHQRVVNTIRHRLPNAKIVLGGSGFSLFPRALLDRLGADYGVAGEGEEAFPWLLDQLEHAHGPPLAPPSGRFEAPGLVRMAGLDDLDRAPWPARDLFDTARYFREGGSVNIQSKRGCALKCSYCTYPSLEGAFVRLRKPRSVVDELESAVTTWGADCFFFVDSVFNIPPDHAVGICDEIIRRGLRITWTAYLSPARLSPDLVEKMAASGCRSVDFGTDAASDRTLAALRKGFTVDDVRNASTLCHKNGIKFSHSLILGGPGETWSTLQETIDNVVEMHPTAVLCALGVRLYPGTALAEWAISQGVLPREQIGLEPVYYLSDELKEELPGFLEEVTVRHRNWVVPGIETRVSETFRRRVRARGIRGPIWELLS